LSIPHPILCHIKRSFLTLQKPSKHKPRTSLTPSLPTAIIAPINHALDTGYSSNDDTRLPLSKNPLDLRQLLEMHEETHTTMCRCTQQHCSAAELLSSTSNLLPCAAVCDLHARPSTPDNPTQLHTPRPPLHNANYPVTPNPKLHTALPPLTPPPPLPLSINHRPNRRDLLRANQPRRRFPPRRR